MNSNDSKQSKIPLDVLVDAAWQSTVQQEQLSMIFNAMLFNATKKNDTTLESVFRDFIDHHQLPLEINWHAVSQLNKKYISQHLADKKTTDAEHAQRQLLLLETDKQGQLQPIIYANQSPNINASAIIKVTADWHKLQRRVVSAGRKSELLLQAVKLSRDMTVIDATAGFGHDSLILASTGAQVTMLESHPVMALLLLLEQVRMSQQNNWQALMSRLTIYPADAQDYLRGQSLMNHDVKFNRSWADRPQLEAADVVYLDPMFPDDSYKDAKVGKHMQLLHGLVMAPSLTEEVALLESALAASCGRVVVKRPLSAPPLAQSPANESWQNDVIRFDAYFV